MATGYILTNKKAGNGNSEQELSRLRTLYPEPLVFLDVTQVGSYAALFEDMAPDDYLILAGGDGTLNHFINDTAGLTLPETILYFPIGTGNDFARELGHSYADEPFPIGQYLARLPEVEVCGQRHRFLNGIGFGIDGYCSEEGDRLRARGKRNVNYTRIAIRGLLWGYRPRAATVTVDGQTRTYKKTWLVPTMYGKCYGGGMIPTPQQDRTAKDATLSTMVIHDCGKLKTLLIFPGIFKGEHVRHTDVVDVLSGREITVEFDRPTPLQIDGETIPNVTSYRASVVPADRRAATV